MAKREIPLFVFDKNRWHSQGECDFIICADIDNSFVARVDYVTEPEMVSDTVKIVKGANGINLKLEIKRITGQNPSPASIRTLMRKACDYICENSLVPVHSAEPTNEECISFLDVLIDSNRHHLKEAGSDYNAKKIVATSLNMLQVIRDKIKQL